ncbi:MAG: nitrilase-related carbon-nitrogen hydrolase, partial [Chthonomonadales bacterium]
LTAEQVEFTMRIAIAQIKPRKAEYRANLARLGETFLQINKLEPRPNVLVLPETALTGYFLEGGVRDVALSREGLFDDLSALYAETCGSSAPVLDILLGFYELCDGKYYNSALYASMGGDSPGIIHVHRKFFLPTYGVFDEKRFVARGRSIDAFHTDPGRSSVLICEDVWHSVSATLSALKGAQIIYVISASPGRDFHGQSTGNLDRWDTLLPGIAEEHCVFVVYAGLVGFEGGKGFTGTSQVVDPWGKVLVKGPLLDECLLVADIDLDDVAAARAGSPYLADLESTLTDIAYQFDGVARNLAHMPPLEPE